MASIVNAVLEADRAERPAIVRDGSVTTYGELADLTGRLTQGLRPRVREAGDVCLVVSHPDLEESLALTLAGWSLGLRVAVLPPYLKARERESVLAACEPVMEVSDTTIDAPGSLSFATLLRASRGPVATSEDSAWHETFTSGTTGRSKCVDRRVSRLSHDIDQLVAATGITADDRVTAMTTALSTTSVLPALYAGATVVTIPLQSPRQFWQAIGEQRITVVSGTPYAYELAIRKRPRPSDVSTVRLALTTSARLRPTTIRQLMADAGIIPRNIMCSSESGHIAYNQSEDPEVISSSVGRPLPGVQVEIRGEDGAVLPDTREGRVCVRSPFTATRYRKNPRETASVFQGDWVVSTDIGYRDKQGFIHLTGRNDHKIHFGAAKLDPQEIEDALLRHPAVTDAMVVGEDHPRLGQTPTARVVASPGTAAEELLGHCREQLSATKVPQRIEFVVEIPKDFKGQPVRPRYVRFDQ
ncbi:fatty acid--CoA ligase family protein [Streptomyces sp. B6B3]|uniref:class I adenylate-forming enzyme family protein n=1 Tax=Streptomyces sp. B6B3 TaxID=3153570 RepID=UPI00325CAFD3